MDALARRNRGIVGAVLLLVGALLVWKKSFSGASMSMSRVFAGIFMTLLPIIYLVALFEKKSKIVQLACRIYLVLWLAQPCILFILGIAVGKMLESAEAFWQGLAGLFIIYVLPFGIIFYLLWQGSKGVRAMVEADEQFVKSYQEKLRQTAKSDDENNFNQKREGE